MIHSKLLSQTVYFPQNTQTGWFMRHCDFSRRTNTKGDHCGQLATTAGFAPCWGAAEKIFITSESNDMLIPGYMLQAMSWEKKLRQRWSNAVQHTHTLTHSYCLGADLRTVKTSTHSNRAYFRCIYVWAAANAEHCYFIFLLIYSYVRLLWFQGPSLYWEKNNNNADV